MDTKGSYLGIVQISLAAPLQDILQWHQQQVYLRRLVLHRSFLLTISYICGHLFFFLFWTELVIGVSVVSGSEPK